jgi:hypothetical protein
MHIGLDINVGTLLEEALNHSYRFIIHPDVDRSPSLRAGGGQVCGDQGRNGRRGRRLGGVGT